MTATATRLLNPNDLPPSLWDHGSETLVIPKALSDAYVHLVDANNLRELAAARQPGDGAVGGLSKEQTDEHFAQAFDGSVARALLAVIDPKNHAGSTSNTFIRCTAGSAISLTDAPCGAGAAGLAFLSAIAELRASKILPREPLHVRFVGAELSTHARNYAAQILGLLRSSFEEQAIFVDAQFLSWDVTDELSNTELVRECVRTSCDVNSRLLVVANFNGFLERERRREDAKPQLSELFRYASGKESFAVWIEPNMNRATGSGGLFSWVRSQLITVWRKFARSAMTGAGSAPMHVSEARFRLPLSPGDTARVTLAVMPIELGPDL